MALAAIILVVDAENREAVEKMARCQNHVLETRPTPPDAQIHGLAVVLEASSDKLTAELKRLESLPGVTELQFVFADYGDDLHSDGTMPAPDIRDHEGRKCSG